MEALALLATQYNFMHKYLNDRSYTRSSPLKFDSPRDLLTALSEDKRFDSIKNQGFDQLESVFVEKEAEIMEYWNGLSLDDPSKQFELSLEAAVAVLMATAAPGSHTFNYFLANILTTGHAVRVLLPIFPSEHRVTLFREWWLLILATFIVKGRPKPSLDNVDQDTKGREWKYVEYEAVNSRWATNAQYVKGKISLHME